MPDMRSTVLLAALSALCASCGNNLTAPTHVASCQTYSTFATYVDTTRPRPAIVFVEPLQPETYTVCN